MASKSKGKALVIGLVIGGGALLLGMSKASAAPLGRGKTKMRLTKDFRLEEFLRSSTMPEIESYLPTAQEIANVTLLAQVLQDLRDSFKGEYPITITSGARPLSVTRNGKTIDDLLRAKGYKPVPNSGHHLLSGADIELKGANTVVYSLAFDRLKADRRVRQIIAYTAQGGIIVRLHVEVVSPGRPRNEKTAALTMPESGMT